MDDEAIISAILAREGGYVDHASDRGGATNFGITLKTLSDFRGKPATKDDVKAMLESEARLIYRQRYIVDPGLYQVKDDKLRALLVDCAVNHGPVNAVKFLQRAVKAKADGKFGTDTFTAMVAADPAKLYLKVVAERAKFYGQIITHDTNQGVFAAGWMARLAEFITA